jgi:hypothetical protein
MARDRFIGDGQKHQKRIWDGLRAHFQQEPPQYQVPQRDMTDPHAEAKIKKELTKVKERCYIAPGLLCPKRRG